MDTAMDIGVCSIKVKYNDNEIILELNNMISIGELQEKILSKMNTSIYDIQYINLSLSNTNNIVLGSDELLFSTIFNEIFLNSESYIEIIPRNDLNNIIRNNLISKYLKHLQIVNDEQMAKQLHNRYNHQQQLINSNVSVDIENLNIMNTNDSNHPGDRLFDRYITNFRDSISNTTITNILEDYINNNTVNNNLDNLINIGLNSRLMVNESNNINSMFINMNAEMNGMDQLFSNINNTSYGITYDITYNQINPSNFGGLFNILNNMNININETTDMDDVKMILTDDEIAELTIEKYDDSNNYTSTTCNICLDNYDVNCSIIILECKHYYHPNCITQWLSKNSNKCPICRETVSTGIPNHNIS
jgi:hypothetical protein